MGKFLTAEQADQLSRIEQRNTRGKPQGLVKIMGNHYDRLSQAPLQIQKLLLQLRASDWIECAEGFVHQQNAGVGRQRPCHPDTLPLATGELMWVSSSQIRVQPDKLHEFGDACSYAILRPTLKPRHHSDIAFHRVVRKKSGLLDHPSDRSPQQNWIPRDRAAAIHLYFAIRRRKQAIDELQRSGLTRATSPEQNQMFTCGNREAAGAQQTLIGEFVANFTEFNDRRGSGALVRAAHLLEWYRRKAILDAIRVISSQLCAIAKFCLQYGAEIASLGFISTYPKRRGTSEKTVDHGICPRSDSVAELRSGQRPVRTERNKRKHCVFGTDSLR